MSCSLKPCFRKKTIFSITTLIHDIVDHNVTLKFPFFFDESSHIRPFNLQFYVANVRVPTVVGVNRIPSIGLNASAIQLENQHSVSCFAWNGERFCILGGTIFMFKDGKAVSFVSGLPVGSNDYVKVS